MDTSRRSILKAAAAAPLLALPGTSAFAQASDYPSKAITSISMFPAGTGGDIIVRYYATKMQAAAGRPIVVENKIGMGGSLAAGYVAQSKPDGYTIFMSSSSALAAAPSLFKKLPYDPLKDFANVTPIFKAAFLFLVPSSSPIKTLADLTEHLKQKGDKASYGSATHPGKIASEIYKAQYGLKTVEVPYKSGVDAMNDMLSGQLDFYVTDSGTAIGQIGPGGRLRALSTTAKDPIAALSMVPSAGSLGLNMDLILYWAMYVPAGTPKPIMDKVDAWVQPIVNTQETRDFLGKLGFDPWVGTAKDVDAMVAREAKAWAEYVKLAKIEPQ